MFTGIIAGLPQWLVLTASAIVGLLVGSFLNVVIHRIPLGLSIVRPGSACASCGASIAAFDNIPILSFLLLKGRCRNCRKRISLRYPFVEILTCVLFACIVWLHGPTWRSLGEWWFVSILIALIVIDAEPSPPSRSHHLPVATDSLSRSRSRASRYLPNWTQCLRSGQAGFSRWRVALLGATIIIGSSLAFWLLDQLDSLLFGKYYDYQDEDPAVGDVDDAELDRQYTRTNRLTRGLGLLFALVWMVAVVFDGPRDPGAL
jgi:leader peptidase (prepilin peptidase)/N-methyltransferase